MADRENVRRAGVFQFLPDEAISAGVPNFGGEGRGQRADYPVRKLNLQQSSAAPDFRGYRCASLML
jgi:hypothetical protein